MNVSAALRISPEVESWQDSNILCFIMALIITKSPPMGWLSFLQVLVSEKY